MPIALEATDHLFPKDYDAAKDRVLADRLLVDHSTPEEMTTEGGLVVPGSARKDIETIWGSVVQVGPDVKEVIAGDRIAFHDNAGYEVVLGLKKYVVMKEGEVMLVRRS